MAERIVLTEDRSPVEILILNRPDVLNALNLDLLHALKEQIDLLQARRDIRVVIITGAGDKAFSAGADLEERSRFDVVRVKHYLVTLRTLYQSIETLNKPVIAAINGVALGGGTELALACDIRIACTHATMGLPETRIGIIPGGGGTQRLARLIGPGMAKELIFTGRRVGADEALKIGLVNHVFDRPSLLEECTAMAAMICEAAPIAVEQAKHAIDSGLKTDFETGLDIEFQAYGVTLPTVDRSEGLAAFREKRKPVFKGN